MSLKSIRLKNGIDVPESVALGMLAEAERDHRSKGHWLEGELRQLDDRLRVRFMESDFGVPWIKKGRWHVLRLNDGGAPPTAMPIETEDGGYCEPHSGILDELRRRDSWALKGSLADHVRAHDKKRMDAKRAELEDRKAEDRKDLALAVKIGLNPRPRWNKPANESARGDKPRR